MLASAGEFYKGMGFFSQKVLCYLWWYWQCSIAEPSSSLTVSREPLIWSSGKTKGIVCIIRATFKEDLKEFIPFGFSFVKYCIVVVNKVVISNNSC